ncbi:Pentatricopeptide repeat-containing protein [Hirschfeldia incana]|nr:Pentatricopeptide repeat-containing protein [Hirschfeldia incana]
MYRSKSVLPSLRNAYTKISNRSHRSRVQVCFPSKSSSSIISPWQFHSFTSKPESMLQLVLENDWSKQVAERLRKQDTPLTHETAIYVLRKLAKHPEKAYSFLSWVLRESDLTPSSPLYSTFLRMIVVQQRPMNRFWTTLNDMKQGGFCLDEETYKNIYTLLNRESYKDATALTRFYESLLEDNAMSVNVSSSVSKRDWSCEVERELQDMKLPLSDNFVIRVLKELKEHPLKAFSFLRWVGGRGCSYKHSTVTYNAALRVLARPSSVAEFWSVVAEMKEAGHEVDFDTYIKASRQFQVSRMMNEAVKLYEFMTDGPFKPSVEDCGLLLRSLSAGPSPHLDLVYRVSRKYESTGKPLSKAVYDGIHRYLTSVARFDEAEDTMKGMRDAGYEPDNVTYSQLVFGLCKAERLEEARGVVLDQMEADGCLPDVKTWTVLIKGHFENSEVDKAFACFEKMVEKGIGIDSGLLDVMVGMFLSQNRVQEACGFLKEKVENGNVKAWRSTYKGVIDKLNESKKGEEALDLVRMMMMKQNCPAYAKERFDGKMELRSSKYYYPTFCDVMEVRRSKYHYPTICDVMFAFYGLPGMRALVPIFLRRTRMNAV